MLIYKKATFDDMKTVSDWHKHESVNKWIYVDDWFKYFNAVKDNPNYYLYLIYQNQMIIAHTAAEKTSSELSIDLIVSPKLHGQGLGTMILIDITKNSLNLFGNISSITAGIYPNNLASKRCFEKAGFQFYKYGEDGEFIYRFTL